MSKKLHLRVVTPTRSMFDGEIDMVIVRTVNGDMGFLANHTPLTTTLDYGIMKIINDGETKEAIVLGGFTEVFNNNVTVLSDVCEWPDEIDVKRAKEARERAERRMQQSQDVYDMRRAELAFRRSTVRLEVSTYPIIKGRGIHN